MYSLDLQVWGILVLTCVTSERAAGSRKKDLVPGGVFSFIIIILRSMGVLFGSMGIREGIFVWVLWVSAKFWNIIVSWCFWYRKLLGVFVLYCQNGSVILTRRYGNVWSLVCIWQVRFVVMVLGPVGKDLVLYVDICWYCLRVWQERERVGKLWWWPLRLWRWDERGLIWRLLEHTDWSMRGLINNMGLN